MILVGSHAAPEREIISWFMETWETHASGPSQKLGAPAYLELFPKMFMLQRILQPKSGDLAAGAAAAAG